MKQLIACRLAVTIPAKRHQTYMRAALSSHIKDGHEVVALGYLSPIYHPDTIYG